MFVFVLLAVWGHVFHVPLLSCPDSKRLGGCLWAGAFPVACVLLVAEGEVRSAGRMFLGTTQDGPFLC